MIDYLIDHYVIYRDDRSVKVSWFYSDTDYRDTFVRSVTGEGAVVLDQGSVEDKLYDAVRPLLDRTACDANANGKNVDVDALRQKVAAILASHEQSSQTLP